MKPMSFVPGKENPPQVTPDTWVMRNAVGDLKAIKVQEMSDSHLWRWIRYFRKKVHLQNPAWTDDVIDEFLRTTIVTADKIFKEARKRNIISKTPAPSLVQMLLSMLSIDSDHYSPYTHLMNRDNVTVNNIGNNTELVIRSNSAGQHGYLLAKADHLQDALNRKIAPLNVKPVSITIVSGGWKHKIKTVVATMADAPKNVIVPEPLVDPGVRLITLDNDE